MLEEKTYETNEKIDYTYEIADDAIRLSDNFEYDKQTFKFEEFIKSLIEKAKYYEKQLIYIDHKFQKYLTQHMQKKLKSDIENIITKKWGDIKLVLHTPLSKSLYIYTLMTTHFDILKLLETTRGTFVNDIANTLNIEKNTTSNILANLRKENLVVGTKQWKKVIYTLYQARIQKFILWSKILANKTDYNSKPDKEKLTLERKRLLFEDPIPHDIDEMIAQCHQSLSNMLATERTQLERFMDACEHQYLSMNDDEYLRLRVQIDHLKKTWNVITLSNTPTTSPSSTP